MNLDFNTGTAVYVVVGLGVGYAIHVLRDRALQTGAQNEKKEILEKARLEAEAVTREARLKANEDALKLRTDLEQASASRQKEVSAAEQRLAVREELVNRQLENVAKDEKALRTDRKFSPQKLLKSNLNGNWWTN